MCSLDIHNGSVRLTSKNMSAPYFFTIPMAEKRLDRIGSTAKMEDVKWNIRDCKHDHQSGLTSAKVKCMPVQKMLIMYNISELRKRNSLSIIYLRICTTEISELASLEDTTT